MHVLHISATVSLWFISTDTKWRVKAALILSKQNIFLCFFSHYFLFSWSLYLSCRLIPLIALLPLSSSISLLSTRSLPVSSSAVSPSLLAPFLQLCFLYSLTVSSAQDHRDATVISHQLKRRLATQSWGYHSSSFSSYAPHLSSLAFSSSPTSPPFLSHLLFFSGTSDTKSVQYDIPAYKLRKPKDIALMPKDVLSQILHGMPPSLSAGGVRSTCYTK